MAGDWNNDSTDPYLIVKTFEVRHAPTGEGTRHVCANGTVWQRTFATPQITGVRYGSRRDNRIRPW